MKINYFPWMFAYLVIAQTSRVNAQCDIESKLYADGTMYYFTSPLIFYNEGGKKLQGNVITDNENYFITITPRPFPPREEGMKLKSDAHMTLSNHKEYTLKFYDVNYAPNDTLFKIMFKIEKNKLEDFLKYDAEQIIINMGKEGKHTYAIRINKGAIKDQLACLQNRNH